MKRYLFNIAILLIMVTIVLLGDSDQQPFLQRTNVMVNQLIAELVMVFIGITIGLFIKNFMATVMVATLIACAAFACVYFGFFVSITYELIVAEFIVIMGFASISNLHNVQKANRI